MELRDVLLQVFGFIISVAASIAGTIIWIKWKERRENKPLNQILNFGSDDLIFVFSHREQYPFSILPFTSTEDFLAMNNFISALMKIGWKGSVSVRDTKRLLDADKEKNLVTFCSAKSNSFTEEVIEKILSEYDDVFYFQKIENSEKWRITDGVGNFPSMTYGQYEEYVKDKGVKKEEVAEQSFDDVAIITKVKNPWNAMNKIFIIAGIRGIGTWGASECIKKNWNEIYNQLESNEKNCDFSALIKINYRNCDIKKIKIHSIKILKPRRLNR